MLISELFDPLWKKISVERGSTNLELVDHVADEGIIFRVLEHCFGVFDSLLGHRLWSAATSPALGGRFETGAGIFVNINAALSDR